MWPRALMWIRQGRVPPPPDAVVWPKDEEEIAEIIRTARAHRIPVIPYGAGSGVVGGIVAVRGGIALDLKRLEKVSDVDPKQVISPAACHVVPEVSRSRSSSSTSVHPAWARW